MDNSKVSSLQVYFAESLLLVYALSCIELIISKGGTLSKRKLPEILSLNGSIMLNYLKCNAKHHMISLICGI